MTIQICLQSQFQKRAIDILPELAAKNIDFLLQHQQDHYQALAESHIAINTNQTGTGKTLASFLHLLRPKMSDAYFGNTLLIAPTNELIGQHADDLKDFVKTNHLPHIVIQVHAGIITTLAEKTGWRRAEAFYNLLKNPREPKIASCLDIDGPIDEKRPIAIVTNPDLFYYILQGRFNRLDSRNLTTELIGGFRYIIVDEFHYYSPKQAAAFFLYIALLARFGFFDDSCRMSFLTATPELAVDTFFQNLNTLGIRVSFILPQTIAENDPTATMSTTSVKLEFESSDDGIDRVIAEQTSRIRAYIKADRDVAIISHSLADISASTRCFHADEYQTITGAVSARLRREATQSHLILATPTVDIGYNFSRPNKNRQGLDDLYSTARYLDEFLQRLGRVGRVVKKAEQHVAANAVCVISAAIFEKLQSLKLHGKSLSRNELETVLRDNETFLPRVAFWNYVVTEGFFENGQALKKLSAVFTEQERHHIEAVHNLLAKIFGAQKPASWRQLQARLARYHNLDEEAKKIKAGQPGLPSPLLREFASECAKRNADDTQTADVLEETAQKFPETSLQSLRDKIATAPTLLQQYQEFVLQEYHAVAAIFAFRNAFSGVPVVAFDKHCIFHPKQQITKYDLLHLMKNFQLYIYPGKAQFQAEIKKCGYFDQAKDLLDEESVVYLRINEPLARMDRRRVQFRLSVENLDNFERFDTDRVIARRSIKLAFTSSDGIQRATLPMPENLIDAISEIFIPMIIFSDQTWLKLAGRIRAANFIATEVLVSDSDLARSKKYQALVGTPAFYVARSAFGIRSALERYEGFYIC